MKNDTEIYLVKDLHVFFKYRTILGDIKDFYDTDKNYMFVGIFNKNKTKVKDIITQNVYSLDGLHRVKEVCIGIVFSEYKFYYDNDRKCVMGYDGIGNYWPFDKNEYPMVEEFYKKLKNKLISLSEIKTFVKDFNNYEHKIACAELHGQDMKEF